MEVISTIPGTVRFAWECIGLEKWLSPEEHESNNFADLYLAVQNENGSISQIKYHRFLGKGVGCEYYRNTVGYHNEIFKKMKVLLGIEKFDNEYFHDEDILDNQDPKYFTDHAKAVIAKFLATHDGELFFCNEKETFGDICKNEPIELFWTLYLFFRHNDGRVSHHKFEREYDWRHDYPRKKIENVPYEETSIGRSDFARKLFVM
jgi:hypothetical protein